MHFNFSLCFLQAVLYACIYIVHGKCTMIKSIFSSHKESEAERNVRKPIYLYILPAVNFHLTLYLTKSMMFLIVLYHIRSEMKNSQYICMCVVCVRGIYLMCTLTHIIYATVPLLSSLNEK